MSTALPQPGVSPPPPSGGAADPSMEDILASIRRILSEDEGDQTANAAPAHPEPDPAPASDVLALDPSMLVAEPPDDMPPPLAAVPRVEPPPSAPAARTAEPPVAPFVPAPAFVPVPSTAPTPTTAGPPASDALLGPEAVAATASSMGSLLRTLVSERQQVPVYRGGPTIEDLVRQEIRALLKLWLDTNLPPIVERLVRTEIERVVARALP